MHRTTSRVASSCMASISPASATTKAREIRWIDTVSCGDFYYERDLKGYLMYCQDTSDGAGFEIGDSGGPVFVVNGGTVTIFGVAWGSDSFGTLFSSMQRLELDLGALRVF